MRRRLAAIAAISLICGLVLPAIAAPDEKFSQAHLEWIGAKYQEGLEKNARAGYPQKPEDAGHEALCLALLAWKAANPGGEAKLTLKALTTMRIQEIACGQKPRRPENPKPAPIPGAPAGMVPAPRPEGDWVGQAEDDAIDDFRTWHPDEAAKMDELAKAPERPFVPPKGWVRDPYRGGWHPPLPPGYKIEPYRGTRVPMTPEEIAKLPPEERERINQGGSVDPLNNPDAFPKGVPAPDGAQRIDLGSRRTGQSYPYRFEGQNRDCSDPQDFRFRPIGIPWLVLPQGELLRGIPLGQSRTLPAQLDFRSIPPGRYRGQIEVTCETCGWFVFKSCRIDKQTVELEVTVTP